MLHCNQAGVSIMDNTNQQYDNAVASCKDIFLKKTRDYGTSWRVLRTISVVDQIFIKAKRIRTIQENKSQKISDDIRSEFMGILNYGIIGLIQLKLQTDEVEELEVELVEQLYDEQLQQAKTLMENKNHDYGE